MNEEPKIPAKPGKETIYVDVEDDITSIIDKVETAKQKVVALVLPKRASALQSIVNMRLLKRSADNAGKNAVLITSELALLPLAGAAGLHVASSQSSKPAIPPAPNKGEEPVPSAKAENTAEELDTENLPNKIDYDSSIGDLAEAHEIEHPETIEIGGDEDDVAAATKATEKTPKEKRGTRLKVPNFDRFRLWLIASIAGAIALIVFIILALLVLPKATINIQTTSEPVSANFNLTTSGSATALDETKGIIPSVSKTSDQTGTQTAAATGQQNNGAKASGAVTITNCTSGAVTVPAGTGVSSSNLTFITQSTLSLESGNFDIHGNCKSTGTHVGNVNVVAQTGGAKYNLASGSSFTVSGFPGLSGSNGSALGGGTDNITTVVSQADVDGAVQKITSGSTANTFTQSFENQLASQSYYVFVSTMKAGDPTVTANPAVGQPGSTTVVNVKVTYSVLAVKRDDLVKAISDQLLGQVDKTKEKVETSDILKNANISVGNQSSPTNATLGITINTSAVPILDTKAIKNQAKGQKTAAITCYVSNIAGVKNVTVKLSPFWESKAPSKTSKIIVNVQHVSG